MTYLCFGSSVQRYEPQLARHRWLGQFRPRPLRQADRHSCESRAARRLRVFPSPFLHRPSWSTGRRALEGQEPTRLARPVSYAHRPASLNVTFGRKLCYSGHDFFVDVR
jgi:hypothetical protein